MRINTIFVWDIILKFSDSITKIDFIDFMKPEMWRYDGKFLFYRFKLFFLKSAKYDFEFVIKVYNELPIYRKFRVKKLRAFLDIYEKYCCYPNMNFKRIFDKILRNIPLNSNDLPEYSYKYAIYNFFYNQWIHFQFFYENNQKWLIFLSVFILIILIVWLKKSKIKCSSLVIVYLFIYFYFVYKRDFWGPNELACPYQEDFKYELNGKIYYYYYLFYFFIFYYLYRDYKFKLYIVLLIDLLLSSLFIYMYSHNPLYSYGCYYAFFFFSQPIAFFDEDFDNFIGGKKPWWQWW